MIPVAILAVLSTAVNPLKNDVKVLKGDRNSRSFALNNG
jgi:hypothetical protein